MKTDIENNNNVKVNNEDDQHRSNVYSSKGQQIFRKNYQVSLSVNY